MTYNLTYDEEKDLILGHVHGDLDSAIVKKMAGDLAGMIRKHGCTKVLNDLRGAKITPSVIDIYSIPRVVDQTGVPSGCKRALLVSGPIEDYRFLETTSVNFGQQVRIFTDPDAAIEWLADNM